MVHSYKSLNIAPKMKKYCTEDEDGDDEDEDGENEEEDDDDDDARIM